MSKKSRKKARIRAISPNDPDHLKKQKAIAQKTLVYYGISFACFFIITVLMAFFLSSSPGKVGETICKAFIFWGLGAFTCYLFFSFVERIPIFLNVRKIIFSTEELRLIKTTNVHFLRHPRSRHCTDIICIVLKDENGVKYYYLTPGIDDSAKKRIQNELSNTTVNLICYKGTNFIKQYQAFTVYDEAHEHCANNRKEIVHSKACGCFHCLKVFSPSKIERWIDKDDETALCPFCNIDSVIGDASGFSIKKDFLSKMKKIWF